MVDVNDVADEILERLGTISTWKQQKLVFYANAIHLARTGEPLFPEPVKGYKHGPVVERLFKRFQGRFSVSAQSVRADRTPLSGSAKDAVDEALRYYGHQSADWLQHQTHLETPWNDAWNDRGRVITDQELIDFYGPAFNDPEVDAALADSEEDPGLTPEQFRERYLSA